ncbi:hypothetical protein N665_0190s0018 [Sinapis alba]|nr:hypothetical protein N665_0190s0018 [Sinapis alba]
MFFKRNAACDRDLAICFVNLDKSQCMVNEVKAQFPQVAWSFVNDCYGTTLCLQYKPRHIAAGAFFLAAEHLTVDLQSYGEGLFQEFDITPGQLEDIRGQMLELYVRKDISTSQGSIIERSNGGDKVHQPVLKDLASIDKCPSSDTGGGGQSKVNTEGIEKDNSESEAGNRDVHSIRIVASETVDVVWISLLEKDSQLRLEEVKVKREKDKKSSEEGIKKMGLSEREVKDVELHDEDDKTVEMGSQSSLIATGV